MSRRRALDDEQIAALNAWYCDYERVGSLAEKARELNVDEQTIRDAIARVRGLSPRPVKRKLTTAEINQLIDGIHVEPSEVS